MKYSVSQKPFLWLKPGVATLSLMGILMIGMHQLSAKTIQAQASLPVPQITAKPSQDTPSTDSVGLLPKPVEQKVLAIASKDLKVPINQLKIAAARSRVWDGCLGVAGPKTRCTRIAIPGWQVIVTGQEQYGVYHLNQTATLIKRNPTTSGKGTLVLTFGQPDSTIVPATEKIIFQSTTSGGIAGLSYKTLLRKNGQVVRMDLRKQPPTVPTLIRQLTPKQVQEFSALLQQNEFEDFLGFNYSPIAGADYFAIALMIPGESQGIQYADMVQDQTPQKLQRIIQAWNRITSSN